MKCDNCSSGEATNTAYFSDHNEHWCSPCYEEYYLGSKVNPHAKPCELCPEGKAYYVFLSDVRDNSFNVCIECREDLVAEMNQETPNK